MPRTVQREIPSFVYDPNCVLYVPLWKRDAKDGDSFISDDATGHPCTVTGATWGIQGRTFNGTSDYIDYGNNQILNNLPSFTWVVWAKPTTIGPDQNAFFTRRHTKNAYITTAGNVEAYAEKAGAGTSPISTSVNILSVNNWYHIAFTYNDTTDKTWRIYINGAEVTYTTQTAGVGDLADDSSYNVRLGTQQDSITRFFAGIKGVAMIYSRVLSVAEIQRNYLATKWRFQ